MINNSRTYVIDDKSIQDEIIKTAIDESADGSLVVLLIETSDVVICDCKFKDNIKIVIEPTAEKILFENCTFSMKGHGIVNGGERVLFEGCTLRCTGTSIESTGMEVFNNCTFFLTRGEDEWEDGAVISSFRNDNMPDRLNYTVIKNSYIYMDKNMEYGYIAEGDAGVAVLYTKIYTDGSNVMWTKDMVNSYTFAYYGTEGIATGEECCYEIPESELDAYSMYNLLSGDDKWHQIDRYDDKMEKKYFYVNIRKNMSIIAGTEAVETEAYFFPKELAYESGAEISGNIKYNCSENISLTKTEIKGNSVKLYISGENSGQDSEHSSVSLILDNWIHGECMIEVKPCMLEPPKFLKTPEIIIKNGRAVLNYEISLDGNEDMSQISWYRVDNVDRTRLFDMMGFKRSNEKDCRKIAISRNEPCREIALTSYDVGKHIKVNIKPRHMRSESGPGLNVTSRIIMMTDVPTDNISIKMQNQVLDAYYKSEPGYGTVMGCWRYERLPGNRHYSMVTESNECSYYYEGSIPNDNMTVFLTLDFENNSGEGFGRKGEYQEIYIKYDVKNRRGYGMRYECMDIHNHLSGFTLYKYDGVLSQPISSTVTDVGLKSGMDIKLDIYDNVFTAEIYKPDGENTIVLRAGVDGNSYSGMGIKHKAVSVEGNRIGIRSIEMSFPIE